MEKERFKHPNCLKKSDILSWVLAIVVIISQLAISHGDTTLVAENIPKIFPPIRYCLFILMLFLINWQVKISNTILLKIILAFIWLGFSCLHLASGVKMSGLLDFLLMFAFAFCSDNVLEKSISLYRKYIIVVALIGILACIDFFILHIIPCTIVPYYFGETSLYVNYYLSYLIWYGGTDFRLCGTFNEPGIFGTVLALLLIMDGLNLKKISNIIMLIAACLTFSMASFMLLIVAWTIHSLRNIKYFVAIVSVVIAGIIILPKIENNNVQQLVSRFYFNSKEGKFEGDDRKSTEFAILETRFDRGDDKILGMGTGFLQRQNTGHLSSYKSIIIEWGYLGFILTAGLFFISSFIMTKHDKEAVVFWLCAVLSLYSRNDVYTVFELFIMYGGIAWTLRKKQIQH